MTTLIESGFESNDSADNNSMIQIEQSRAVAEAQACYVIAKRFPRDEHKAYSKIMKSCERPFLAKEAMYCYPRSGQDIKGPSIRLAEVLAQSWGNIEFGIREISQSAGTSVAEAYAIDLETNASVKKIFHVPHIRYTKKGMQKLNDPRDIYELVANNGARRMRACILNIIPGDVTEAAIERCNKTLLNSKEPIADGIRRLVIAFSEYGINTTHLEKRLNHKLDSIIPQELVNLRAIYKSIKDGMAKREDYFDMGAISSTNEHINNLISNKKGLDNNENNQKNNEEIEINTFESSPTNIEKPSEFNNDTRNMDDFRVETDASNNRNSIAEKITQEQIQTIENLSHERKFSLAKTRKILNDCGVSLITELSASQADNFISILEMEAIKI